jgi:hypothetical protein
MYLLRLLARPLGHLSFAIALLALSSAAKLLGDNNQLGVICGRLSKAIWRHPDVTRTGVRLIWILWAVLFAVAISPIDPLATQWDGVALAACGLAAVWRRLFASRRD